MNKINNQFFLSNIIRLRKEKSEENISSSSSSYKKEKTIIYKKKHIKKDFLNTMKIKPNIMTLYFNNYKNKSKNNLKQNFNIKNINKSKEKISS